MPVDFTTTQTGGWEKDQFEPSPLMSTYLLAFVVSEFKPRRRTVGGGLEVGVGLKQTITIHNKMLRRWVVGNLPRIKVSNVNYWLLMSEIDYVRHRLIYLI